MYKLGCILWIKQEEGIPCFASLKQIFVPEQRIENMVFMVHQLRTHKYNPHLNAFEVSKPPNPVQAVLKQGNLKYHLPLHIIHPCFDGHETSYICPKYEYPSEEE